MPVRLGDLLREAGHVSQEQLDAALDRQAASGRKLGAELVAAGHISEMELARLLSKQLSVPWVSLYRVEFSRELLRRVPAALCESTTSIPVYVRRHKRSETLFVAMDDPTDESALAAIRDAAGMSVKPMVAPPTEIREALRAYYGAELEPAPLAAAPGAQTEEFTDEHELPEARAAEPKQGDGPAATPAAPASPASPATLASPAAPGGPGLYDEDSASRSATSAEDEASVTLPAEVEDFPVAPEDDTTGEHDDPDFVTLTLQDGAEVRLPRRGAGHQLTASDLVSLLLAKSQGLDVDAVLEAPIAWERLFATLLQVLLRKGVIADWEFVDALRRREDGEALAGTQESERGEPAEVEA